MNTSRVRISGNWTVATNFTMTASRSGSCRKIPAPCAKGLAWQIEKEFSGFNILPKCKFSIDREIYLFCNEILVRYFLLMTITRQGSFDFEH